MMHDNLWFTWFPKDSATTTAGWKRQGIFHLQEHKFFGKKNEVTGEVVISIVLRDESITSPFLTFCEEVKQGSSRSASELICEMFSTILIHVGHQQVSVCFLLMLNFLRDENCEVCSVNRS